MDSFIVSAWQRILGILKWISVFQILQKLYPRGFLSFGFVDIWVIFNSLLSLVALFVAVYMKESSLLVFLMVWGIVRIFEITIYQINMMMTASPLRKTGVRYLLRSYRRVLILTLHNYIEVGFWFAAFYATLHKCFLGDTSILENVSGAWYFSIITMTTLGYGDITPNSTGTRFLVSTHTLLGVLMLVLVVARYVTYLKQPSSMDRDEK